MKRLVLATMAMCLPLLGMGQKIAIKSNLLYDLTTTFNLGLETGLGKSTTLDISGNYNPWSFDGGDLKWKHWMVQPELRWWTCGKFNGHFFGLHAHGGQYNVSGFKFTDAIKDRRYEGHFVGGGISWGYQWLIGQRWNLEFTVGAGYARYWQKKYPVADCGELISSKWKNYWGPTKLGLTFIYIIH